MTPRKPIGLYFGSFNPPHVGHTIVAQYMLGAMDAEEAWLVVSPHNPFKKKEGLLDEQSRVRMVEAACSDIPGLRASDVEFSLSRPSYTIDTLRHLKKEHLKKDFFLIMGSDNIIGIHGWKDSEELLRDYPIAVYPRPGYRVSGDFAADLPRTVTFVEAPALDLSSTEVRRRISSGEGFEAMVRSSVGKMINENDFYER